MVAGNTYTGMSKDVGWGITDADLVIIFTSVCRVS